MANLSGETEVIGDRNFSVDEDYNYGMKSQSLDTIREILKEIADKIAMLLFLGMDKTFSQKSKIKLLKYKYAQIEKRYKIMSANKCARIERIKFKKEESDIVRSLTKIILSGSLDTRSHKKRPLDVNSPVVLPKQVRDKGTQNREITQEEVDKIGIQLAIDKGEDLNVLFNTPEARERCIAAGFGHRLTGYVEDLINNSKKPSSNSSSGIITELDENGITVAKFADGKDKFSATKSVNGNSFFEDLVALRDHDLEVRKAELEKGINRIQIDIAKLADTITEEIIPTK